MLTASDRERDQRVDNFLFRTLKSLPKAHVYRILRKGEVRVNKKRVGPEYRLQIGDQVRIPPVVLEKQESLPVALNRKQKEWLKEIVILETDDFMVVNKPTGLSVHAGSDTRVGLIEALRIEREDLKFIELVHRIDKETSGCLLIAKKPAALKGLQMLLRDRNFKKTYHLIVKGAWPKYLNRVDLPVEGKPSSTTFQILKKIPDLTYLSAILHTGRQHQIRLHCKESGHPIVGDTKYGDFAFNREIASKTKIKNMFLHAYQVVFEWKGEIYEIEAPVPNYYNNLL